MRIRVTFLACVAASAMCGATWAQPGIESGTSGAATEAVESSGPPAPAPTEEKPPPADRSSGGAPAEVPRVAEPAVDPSALDIDQATKILRAPGNTKPNPAALARARALFGAGARAYDRGDYAGAIQAMEAAYSHAARPGILYSIGQAYRHIYLVKRGVRTAATAAAFYRAYVERDPAGLHAAEAFAHLATLQVVVDRANAERRVRQLEAERRVSVSRLLITTSVEGARLEIDGESAGDLPFIAEVKPGGHRVRVLHRGYFPYAREVHVPDGAVVNLDVPLRPRPVAVDVSTREESRLYLDGELVGETPLAGPLRVLPGKHVIELRKNGHLPTRDVVFVRAARPLTVSPRLELTTRRKLAWGALASAGVGATFTTGFAILAASSEQQARNLLRQTMEEGNVDPDQFESAVSNRDLYRGLAIGTGIATASLAVTGVVLYAFDEPEAREEAAPGRRAPEPADAEFELGASPVYLPGGAGLTVNGRF